MLSKLAFRNVRKTVRDYGVYLITMILVTALMFAFHSMMFSPQIKKLVTVAGVMEAMIGIAAGFIVLIVSWLVRYIVAFMMEKRSREFGIYLLIGMNKKQIRKIFMKENTIFGLLAFVIGMVPGIFLEQVLTSVFYHIFGEEYTIHFHMELSTFLLTSGLYAGTYLLALWRVKRRMKKMNIRKFMDLEKKNEGDQAPVRKWRRIFLPLSICYVIGYGVILYTHRMHMVNGMILSAVLVFMIYLFFEGLAAWLFWYIERGGKGVYKKDRLFLLRQLASKIHSMKFTMGTVTILFACAVLGTSCAMMLYDYQNKMMTYQMPFDVLVFAQDPQETMKEDRDVIEEKAEVKDLFTYHIYQNGKDTVNRYLMDHLEYMKWEFDSVRRENKRDVKMNVQDGIVEAMASEAYFQMDTYMKESDYNRLRSMLGYEPVALSDGEYCIQTKPRMKRYLKQFSRENQVEAAGRTYSCQGIYTEAFGQNGHNGADYVIVLPDEAAASMEPYYTLLAADLKGEAPKGLLEELERLESRREQTIIEEKIKTYGGKKQAEEAEKFIWGSGTDEVISMTTPVLVQTDLEEELNYLLTAIAYPLIYVAAVFVCTALTVLAVQQLSDASRHRYRYDVLSKLGVKRGEINRIIQKQLLWYYGIPILFALALGAMIVLFMGERFVLYTGIASQIWAYFAGSTAVLMVVVLLYLAVTYTGFKRNVNLKGYRL